MFSSMSSVWGYQQNAPPFKNKIAYYFFDNGRNPTIFFKMLRSMIFSIFEKFSWILVINKKVISNCIFERWCVLLVTPPCVMLNTFAEIKAVALTGIVTSSMESLFFILLFQSGNMYILLKFLDFIFAQKFICTIVSMPLEHFQKILKFSMILTTFSPYFSAFFDPSKWALPRWPTNSNFNTSI